MEQVLGAFAPLLQAIVAATADESQRGDIEQVLTALEEQGWKLSEAVKRIWAGDRDPEALTTGIGGNSAKLVHRLLQLLDQ